MRSVTLEFLRYGKEPGILSEGDPYLAICGSKPVRQFAMPFDHEPFFLLLQALRYQAPDQEQKAALQELAIKVTRILEPPMEDPTEPLQLDLVTSAAELWALPFEAALGEAEKPLFVDSVRVVVPTRRIRQDFTERTLRWPAKPKVLFAYASPKWAGPEVPAKKHKDALKAALKLEGIPERFLGEGSVLQILGDASLESLAEACQKAQEKQPFTHVHILAHGAPVHGKLPSDEYFGLALESKTGKPTTAEQLVEALMLNKSRPVAVTLAICDGGNTANTIIPGRSIAHTLHRAGIPVVVASQLPLTFAGSVTLTREFYGALLSGSDVRRALYETRRALYQLPPAKAGHDWVSMVAYVQLPEGYADHLLKVRLESALASLETVQRWADKIVDGQTESVQDFECVAAVLRDHIATLDKFLKEAEAETEKRDLYEENSGLLGSAYKRLADLLFARNSRFPDSRLLEESRTELSSACAAYLKGYRHNLSHHWTGVQYLSLRAILDGSLREQDLVYWQAALRAAEIAIENEKEYWALGSIAELLLLAPLAGRESELDRACQALLEMRDRVARHAKDKDFPLASTRRQLRKYQRWWTKPNGFFGGREKDLSEDAARLLEALES